MKENAFLEDLHLDGSIVLKFIVEKFGRRGWTRFICCKLGTSSVVVIFGLCAGQEILGS